MKTKNKIRCTSWTNQQHLHAWFKYKSDNVFAAGPVVIIPILALISICLILIFSSLYLSIYGVEKRKHIHNHYDKRLCEH